MILKTRYETEFSMIPLILLSILLFNVFNLFLFLLQAGDFIHTIGDSHIYLNHVKALEAQITRVPKAFPIISFKRRVENIDDFKFDDIIVSNYNPHPKIDMEMAV